MHSVHFCAFKFPMNTSIIYQLWHLKIIIICLKILTETRSERIILNPLVLLLLQPKKTTAIIESKRQRQSPEAWMNIFLLENKSKSRGINLAARPVHDDPPRQSVVVINVPLTSQLTYRKSWIDVLPQKNRSSAREIVAVFSCNLQENERHK